MPQPHKNLFFFYRGARPKGDDSDLAFDRQLEDNATKALVYVLENADRSVVLGPFLNKFASLATRSGTLDRVQFALQRADINRGSIARRIALSIAPVAKLKHGVRDSHQTGRPDAWIWAEGDFALLLENKIRDQATWGQIRRHIATADGWSGARVAIQSITWSDVYEFFQAVRRHGRLDPVSRLLLDEMTRYIRMTSLANSATFELDDFGYFMLRSEDRHDTQRSLLKRKLEAFAEELISTPQMHRLIKRYAGKSKRPSDFVNPGVLRKDARSYWITVGRKERRDHCHFTGRLSELGISLEAFSPFRSYTQKLIEKIKARPKAFIAAIRSMSRKEPYVIRLREAYYHDPESSYKGQRVSRGIDYMEIHPCIVTEANVRSLIVDPIEERLKRGDLRPEIFVVRNFLLSELVGKSRVVDLVASKARYMLPFLEFALEGSAAGRR